jgi:hypothetical protein
VKKSIFWILVLIPVCFGADRFILDSELRTNFGDDGSTNQFLTGYTYDANGNRVLQRVWEGADSATSAMSSVKFSYNAGGEMIKKVLLSGADTSSIVRYAYDGGKLMSVHTLAKDGTVRFIDSLIYDGQGRNVEEQRISSAAVKTYFHRYTLNAQGKMLADSLVELIAGSYRASQAVLFTYNTDSSVASEAQWRLSGDSWYCVSVAFMQYAAGALVSVATHERDGVGTAITDSLVYAYDADKNRIKEEDYNGNQALTRRIVFTWREIQPVFALMNRTSRNDQRFGLGNKQGRLTADLSSQNRGMITLFDMAGKRISRIAVDHSGIAPLQGLIGRGSYVALFTSGMNKQVTTFTSYN